MKVLPRVLLVDDDVYLPPVLRRRFGRRFALTVASTAEEALVTAQAGDPYAAVVCDLGLPQMDGLELLDRMRVVSPDTIRIVLTGNAQQATAVEAINRIGIFRFFNKPCPTETLAEAIEAAIGQYRLHCAERALAENEARWRMALEAVGDAVWDWDPEAGTVVYSAAWADLLGGDVALSDGGINVWWDRIHLDDKAAALDEFQRLSDGVAERGVSEHRLVMPDGRMIWLLARGVVLERGADGRPSRVIGTVSDISTRKDLEEALRQNARSDALTGLANRRYFLERATADVKRAVRAHGRLSILMIDIDFFKRVNDTYGHAAGDRVLREVATRLRGGVRGTDLVGRLGGEEFALLLADTGAEEACGVASTLRLAIAEKPILLEDGAEIGLTVSIGVADLDRDDATVEQILGRADDALYLAKRQGRDRVVRHSDTVVQSDLWSGFSPGNQINDNGHGQSDNVTVAPTPLAHAKVGTHDR